MPRLLVEAEAELLAAILYDENCRAGLGQEFFAQVATTMASIAKDPLRNPTYEGRESLRKFRRVPLKRFPYIVVYEVRNEETLVIAVAHSARQPSYWDHRET
ncbi:MAG: type II toxin-antitoxin system RelE/ParE family toxin [Planctomycetota bacterium]